MNLQMGGENLNYKAALVLIVIFFASAATVVAVSLNAPTLSVFGGTEKRILDEGYDPKGDPIGGPGPPY
jgi:hypothetical protein